MNNMSFTSNYIDLWQNRCHRNSLSEVEGRTRDISSNCRSVVKFGRNLSGKERFWPRSPSYRTTCVRVGTKKIRGGVAFGDGSSALTSPSAPGF